MSNKNSILAIVCFQVFIYGFAFQAIPPILTFLISAFEISYAQAGLLMTVFGLPGIFLSIPGGILFDRYGVKKLLLFSILLLGIGSLVVAISASFWIAIIGRLISGIGGAIIIIGAPMLVTMWFPHDERGRAMGIFSVTMPIAMIVAFSTFGMLSLTYGWRFPFYLCFVLSVIIAIASWILIEVKPNDESIPSLINIKKHIQNSNIWQLGITWMLASVASIAFFTYAPDFLFTEKGFEFTFASIVASLMLVGSIPLTPFFGHLSDKIGKRKMFIFIGNFMFSALIPLILISSNWIIILLIIIIGFFTAMISAPTFALTSEVMEPEAIGLGFGILSTCASLGYTIGPPLAGFLRDIFGFYYFTFWFIAAFPLMAATMALLMKTR